MGPMPRSLQLPSGVPGRVSLHSMPGARESFEEFLAWAARERLDAVVCLNPPHELRRVSPDYAAGLAAASLPWQVLPFPIDDFGVPDDQGAFLDFVLSISRRVHQGEHVLIHCMMGIGRTGTTATALLMALGEELRSACDRVEQAGSCAESDVQARLLELAALYFESPAQD